MLAPNQAFPDPGPFLHHFLSQRDAVYQDCTSVHRVCLLTTGLSLSFLQSIIPKPCVHRCVPTCNNFQWFSIAYKKNSKLLRIACTALCNRSLCSSSFLLKFYSFFRILHLYVSLNLVVDLSAFPAGSSSLRVRTESELFLVFPKCLARGGAGGFVRVQTVSRLPL